MESNVAVELITRREGKNDNHDYEKCDNPNAYSHNHFPVIVSLVFGIDRRRFLCGKRINIR